MLELKENFISSLNTDGFVLIESSVDSRILARLISKIESVRKNRSIPGMRHLLSRSEAVKDFALSGVCFDIANQILGKTARPVRSILFDKSPDSNWYVTWHQDVTIPVEKKIETEGFRAWSIKDGLQHVQPPVSILESMVSLRIHLDDCPENNGAIKFFSGSHKSGILDTKEIKNWKETRTETICAAKAGDIIVMRPLILHSSSKSEDPEKRRVLHIEYSGKNLPGGLEWAEA